MARASKRRLIELLTGERIERCIELCREPPPVPHGSNGISHDRQPLTASLIRERSTRHVIGGQNN